ncbi:MAG: glycosyltransferase [Candidatus Eisenbacteria bacterium]|uniref:Glycosyltransferase n=1 Tax=Eiseniibacteriota bacterium TaxID=2212470 RepID=A0A937XDD9_UNCEI|nr:glycosyltransferase [Candidatus Eisenbacteria bacterium]
MPRVCQLITRLVVGGAQRLALELTADLNERGWQAELWCGPQAGPEGTLSDEARARGVPLRLLPDLRREVSPLRDLRALAALRRELRAGGFDLLHTHSSKAGILGREAAAAAGVPLRVHSVHGWAMTPDTPAPLRRLYASLERRAARRAHALVAVSASVRDAGLALGIGGREQYEVIRGGIRLGPAIDARSRTEARQRLGILAGAVVLGTVGRLDDAKDPLGAFAALAPALRERPELRLVFIGDGRLRAPLERAVSAARLEERVVLAGLRADAAALCHAFDVFFLASRWEGFPLAIVEALAAGLPVVAYDVAGVGEAVEEGVNGRLVAPDDARTWRARLLELAGAPEERERMGRAARAGAIARFDLGRMLAATRELYERLLNREVREAPRAVPPVALPPGPAAGG